MSCWVVPVSDKLGSVLGRGKLGLYPYLPGSDRWLFVFAENWCTRCNRDQLAWHGSFDLSVDQNAIFKLGSAVANGGRFGSVAIMGRIIERLD